MNDTHPEVERFIVDGLRRMSFGEKLKRVRELSLAVQQLGMLDVR